MPLVNFITDETVDAVTPKAVGGTRSLNAAESTSLNIVPADLNLINDKLDGVRTAIRAREFNVKHYGATGDGTADDSAAFQAAIDAASEGDVVLIPRASVAWRLASPLVVDKALTLRGEGRALSKVKFATTALTAQADSVRVEGIDFSPTSGAAGLLMTVHSGTNRSGWRFEGCRFEGVSLRLTKVGRTQVGGTVDTTGTGLSESCHVVDCEFTGYAGNYTVEVAGTLNTVLERLHIHDNGADVNAGDGIKVLCGSLGTVVDKCIVERPTRDGIDLYDASCSTVTNCIFRDCGADGVDTKWDLGGSNANEQNIIANNRAENCASHGFDLDMPNTTATGNIAVGCQRGFRVTVSREGSSTPTQQVVVMGNQAIDSALDGFTIEGNRAVFVGNVARDSGAYGFLVTATNGATAPVLVGNSASGNTSGDFSDAGGIAVVFGNTGTGNGFDSGAIIPNNKTLYTRNAAGTLVQLAKMTSGGNVLLGDAAQNVVLQGAKQGFFGTTAASKPTVTGSRGGNAALASLLTALATLGLVTDSSSA